MSKLKPTTLFLLTISIYLGSLFFYKSWTWAVVGGGDPWGYYAYLPATFIHHDLDNLKRTVKVRKRYKPESVNPTEDNPLGIGEALRMPSGRYAIKYTMGVAMLEAPFFAAAHVYAKLTGSYPADGWSLPYMLAIHVAGLCYAMCGLWLLWLTLCRFFTDNASLAVLATLALATNLYYFCVYAPVMAHSFLFFLFALAIYASVRWHETRRPGFALLVGFSCGLVALVRPTEIILLAVPLLFGVKQGHSIKERLQLLRSNKKQVALAVLAFFLILLPQLLYWKWTSGHFLHYSYGEEGFDFRHPHIREGLVGYKNGWLAYTPVMWLGVLGLFWLRRNARDWFWPVAVFLPLHVYLIYSWWCWYYINGFGSRPMVEALPLMAFPLASFYVEAAKPQGGRRKWLLALTTVAVLFCTWLNIFNTWQVKKGLILSDFGKGPYFWRMLGKTKLDYLDLVVYDTGEPQPDPSQIRQTRSLYFDDFEKTATPEVNDEIAFSGQQSLELKETFGDSLQPHVVWQDKIGNLNLKTGQWVRLSVQVNVKEKVPRLYEGRYLTCRFVRGKKSRKTRSLRLDSKPGNVPIGLWGGRTNLWGEAYFWVKVPPSIHPDDDMQVRLDGYNAKVVYVDDLKVEVWE